MAAAGTTTPQRVGEVVAASSNSFTGECYQLYNAPPIGSLVRTGSSPVFGVVYQVRTEPMDPNRPALARGRDADTEDEVYQDNPQIYRLLTSRFDVWIVGHQSEERDYQRLPPLPPRVHSFIYTCYPDEVARFTAGLDFLHLLVHSPAPSPDEVVGACLRNAAGAHEDPREFLVQAGRFLATELSGDLPRLTTILRRIAS